MSTWYTENHLGLYPPFLLHSILDGDMESLPEYYNCKIIERACAKITIENLDCPNEKVTVKGYFTNGRIRIPVGFNDTNVIYSYSCYDKLTLYFYYTDKANDDILRVFRCELLPCGHWKTETINAHEIKFFNENEFVAVNSEFIPVHIRVQDMRDKMYHNKVDPGIERENRINKVKEEYKLTFYSRTYSIENYMCPLCLLEHANINHLKKHINYQHLYYRAELEENQLSIHDADDEQEVSKEFTFISKRYRGRNAQIIGIKNLRDHKMVKTDTIQQKNRIYEIYHRSEYLVKVQKYPLDNKMRIEHESEMNVVTTQALAQHLNSRLRDMSIKKAELTIMEEWNKFRVQKMDPLEAVYNVTLKFGITEETLKLYELLYTQGVVTSLDLMQIVNRYEVKSKGEEPV